EPVHPGFGRDARLLVGRVRIRWALRVRADDPAAGVQEGERDLLGRRAEEVGDDDPVRGVLAGVEVRLDLVAVRLLLDDRGEDAPARMPVVLHRRGLALGGEAAVGLVSDGRARREKPALPGRALARELADR